MKLITFYDDKIIKQLFENVSNVSFDGSNLSFTSNSAPFTFVGFQLYYSEIDDMSTLQIGDSVTDGDILTFIKSQKHIEILEGYEKALVADLTSSVIGSDGNNVIFSFSASNQSDYTQIGVIFALKTDLTAHLIGSKSHGAFEIQRQDYITFLDDCDNRKTNTYNQFNTLRQNIDACTTVTDVEQITWS